MKVTYRCESCRECFEHEDMGKRVYGICPGGGGTDSYKVSKKDIKEQVEAKARADLRKVNKE